ncbi:MAG TPA: hypothetical protein VFO70_10805 [Chitinophagaceae bacterium]|nr:hypothetical protein [Chitinophagaceae bacterium]
MFRLTAIALCILITALPVWSQADTSFRLVKMISGDFEDFTVDNLDNIYILTNHNQVKKFNAAGDSVAIFNNVKKYGKASLIDVSNPLKVLLYYEDFATVVVLDRWLNVVNSIELRKQGILQARAIGQSYDNKVWVYDEMENKLKKIDEDGSLLLETPDFRLLFNEIPIPQKLLDHDKYLYLYDTARGVYVFDYYGALKNKILITGWKNFKLAGKYIFGAVNDKLYRYEISSFRLDEWRMPVEISRSRTFNFSSSRLYALRKDGIHIYSYR